MGAGESSNVGEGKDVGADAHEGGEGMGADVNEAGGDDLSEGHDAGLCGGQCEGGVRIASSFGSRMRGLIGRRRSWLGENGMLLIVPCRSVHTFFMRAPIDVAFIDKKGRVLRAEEQVGPRRVLCCAKAVAVVERFSPHSAHV